MLATLSLVAGCVRGRVAPAAPLPDAPATLETSIFLIGDAGRADSADPVLRDLAERAKAAPSGSVVVFLGDNVYEGGITDSVAARSRAEYEVARARLDFQIRVAIESRRTTYFVPGNHDWGGHSQAGWEAIVHSSRYIQAHGGELAEQVPPEGCPGPVARPVGERILLVFIDSQWWFHQYEKPDESHPGGCPTYTKDQVLAALREVMVSAGRRRVILLAHHPLVSGGEHGGHLDPRRLLFPLLFSRLPAPLKWLPVAPAVATCGALSAKDIPVLCTTNVAALAAWVLAYPLVRQFLPGVFRIGPAMKLYRQDLDSPTYREYRAAIESTFGGRPPLIFAAGHDHDLQVLQGPRGVYQIVSGAGYFGHTSYVARMPETYYASPGSGYMRLDVAQNGDLYLRVYRFDRRGVPREDFAMRL